MNKVKFYLRSIRWFEIGVRMGAPFIAILLSVPEISLLNSYRIIHGLLAFFLLWAHGYTFNEWGGYAYDQYDQTKADIPLMSGKISRSEMLVLSISFACVSILLYALLDIRFLSIVLFDIILGVSYVHQKILFKNVPLVSFIILFLVSVNDFLLGWLIFSTFLCKGLLIAAYFGILGIAGQHYHEAGDYDGDQRAGIKTNAVRYGKKKIVISGFIFYTISCLYFLLLGFKKIVPEYLLYPLVISYPIYLFIFYRCITSDLSSLKVHSFVRRYRILYGFIGLWMIIQLFCFRFSPH